jgi:L-asparaginase
MPDKPLPKILLISTGGTIASRFVKGKGYSPALGGDDFLGMYPELADLAEIDVIQPCNVLSFALTPLQILDIVNIAREKIARKRFEGVIVTQGTATMEETSYLADLLWDLAEPLIFTGSMLNSSERDWDGPRNILNAVLIAVSKDAREKGAMVTLGGEIHAARDVVKIHKTALAPLVSYNTGPLGFVLNRKEVVFHRTPLRRMVFPVNTLETKVDLIKVVMGGDAGLLKASIANGARGIVLEALPGGGGVTPEIMEVVREARKGGVIFVMSPRSPLGSAKSAAGGGCGPFDLMNCGVINAGDLAAVKARVLLMAALPFANSQEELARIFKEIAP